MAAPAIDYTRNKAALGAAKEAYNASLRAQAVDGGEARLHVWCRSTAVPAAVAPNSIAAGAASWAVSAALGKQVASLAPLRRLAAPVGFCAGAVHFFMGIRGDSPFCDACYVLTMAARSPVGAALRDAYRGVYPDSPLLHGAEQVAATTAGLTTTAPADDFRNRLTMLAPFLTGSAASQQAQQTAVDHMRQAAAQRPPVAAAPTPAEGRAAASAAAAAAAAARELRDTDGGAAASYDDAAWGDDESYADDGASGTQEAEQARQERWAAGSTNSGSSQSAGGASSPRAAAVGSTSAPAAAAAAAPSARASSSLDASPSFEWAEPEPLFADDEAEAPGAYGSRRQAASPFASGGARAGQGHGHDPGAAPGHAGVPSWELRRQRRQALASRADH